MFFLEQRKLIVIVEYYLKTGLFENCKNVFVEKFPNEEFPAKGPVN
jgi:hypothetical protein